MTVVLRVRKRRISLLFMAAVVSATLPAVQPADAELIRYALRSFPIGSTDVNLSSAAVPVTVFPGSTTNVNDTTIINDASIEFDFDTEVDDIVAIRTRFLGNQGVFDVLNGDFITGFTSGGGIGPNQTQIVGDGDEGEISIVVEGDLSLGGRIDFVPFNPDARASGGASPLDPTLDTLVFTFGSANFGTLFLDDFLPGPFNVSTGIFDERGGPTLANLTSVPGREFFFYATPVPVPEPGASTILVAGLFLNARRSRQR